MVCNRGMEIDRRLERAKCFLSSSLSMTGDVGVSGRVSEHIHDMTG